jgi:hypothetical protein
MVAQKSRDLSTPPQALRFFVVRRDDRQEIAGIAVIARDRGIENLTAGALLGP